MNFETYGFDLLINLIAKLKIEYPRIGLVIALADDLYIKDYHASLKKRMVELGVLDDIYIMRGQKTLWPLFKYADLLVRPTSTDGDPLSIREANYFIIPTIASNISIRPSYTTCF